MLALDYLLLSPPCVMNIKEQMTSYRISEYEYIPEEAVEIDGNEYIVKGTGTSIMHHMLSFKKNGDEIPEDVLALLSDDDAQKLKNFVEKARADYTRDWHFANLTGLRRSLHHAVLALDYVSEQELAPESGGKGGDINALLPSKEIARLYVLMEMFKRSLSTAGLESPSTDAKDEARGWLEEHPAAVDMPVHAVGDETDINFNPEGLHLYSEKKGVDIPEAFLDAAPTSTSGGAEAPEPSTQNGSPSISSGTSDSSTSAKEKEAATAS